MSTRVKSECGDVRTYGKCLLRCGERATFFMRPRYYYSEAPGSPWSEFLDGLSRNRCKCGLEFSGQPSSFHTESWTAVTLEPPAGTSLPAEAFSELIEVFRQCGAKRIRIESFETTRRL